MTTKNNDQIGKGLNILRAGLNPYVKRQLKAVYKSEWYKAGVDPHLRGTVGLEAKGRKPTNDDERFAALDPQALLTILNNVWGEVFQADLGQAGRSYVNELKDARNKWAHQNPFTLDDTYRVFDTMTRLLEMVAAPERTETGELARQIRAELNAEDKASQPTLIATASGASASLKPWREIATPHPDVSAGRYQQAEFAADLFQVLTGRASSEYGKPKDFFQRTYFTDGLTQLLARAWMRLSGTGGDPVVELQTNFGGGKTHSLLALYHLFGGDIKMDQVNGLENVSVLVKPVPENLPMVKRAVLACNYLSVDSPWKKPDGTDIRTLWGEMAWQLGGKAGFALVAEADRQSVSPGAEKLTHLFEQFGPALILVDEWVVYARQLIGKDNLPAGTFDVNMSFVQALTEATKTAGNALLVAAIPASDAEVGGDNGRIALERIRNVFGRVEAIWKPATAGEAFEIVRRRLFEPLSERAMIERDVICRAYVEMYRENRGDFPPECREAGYEERLRSAYPIHPELFDRLYQDWSTLERFQLTRGVLRLMASVIYELWARGDKSLLIMPGSLPLDSQSVRTEFSRHLPDGWSAVLDKDVDGSMSQPFAIDRDNPNLMRYSACRRVARAVFIGSAPTSSAQKIRGLEEVRVKIGVAQPGETIATFGDALRRLSEQLTYLYSDGSRYWFDTRPTIARIASDRAAQYERKPDLVEDEIIRRVREVVKRERGDFIAIHPIPTDTSEVPDESTCRLVILGPKFPHRSKGGEKISLAQSAAQEFLEKRGNSPRQYRNMLVFLAPDADRLPELEQAIRSWLAWKSIEQDKEHLNLDATTQRQVERKVKESDDTISERLRETYCHLLAPAQEGTDKVEWSTSRLQGDDLIGRASRKLKNDQQMITAWSPALIRMELDKWLWKEKPHLSVKQLWEYLAQYPYLPRLRDEQVLIVAIRDGVGSLTWKDYFAYAAAVREDGHYVGLTAGSYPTVNLDNASVLVKPEIAQKQRDEEAAKEVDIVYPPKDGTPTEIEIGDKPGGETVPQPGLLRRFHGTAELDPSRVGRDAGRIADEVVAHLTSLMGAKAKITIEIDIEAPNGIPEDRVRIVSENCNTLKFKGHGFEEG
jgi:predicted AAA+ superfamily ATPase